MSKSATTEYYNGYWTERPGWTPHPSVTPLKRRLVTRLVNEHTDVLDIGCGDGAHYGQALASIARSYRGLDVSQVAVEVVQQR